MLKVLGDFTTANFIFLMLPFFLPMGADGGLWLPCMLQLYNVASMLSVLASYTMAKKKASHLDKETRFLLLDHLDLIREHLSLTRHDLF